MHTPELTTHYPSLTNQVKFNVACIIHELIHRQFAPQTSPPGAHERGRVTVSDIADSACEDSRGRASGGVKGALALGPVTSRLCNRVIVPPTGLQRDSVKDNMRPVDTAVTWE